MNSLPQFWRVMAKELAMRCHVSTTIDRDLSRFDRRLENEGDQFLTITLPDYASSLETALEIGRVDPNLLFLGWKKRGTLPVFLGGFLDRIFDRTSGEILDEPDDVSIFAIRQLTLVYGKMFLQCDDRRTASAIAQYVKTDEDVREQDAKFIGSPLQRRFEDIAFVAVQEIFSKLDEDVYKYRLLPRHGPGATAERLLGNQKFNQIEWPARLEAVFPYLEYCVPSARSYNRVEDVRSLSEGEERPVRVITVPKTQKTPRIIAIEPVCMQYTQQGLMERVVSYIEADTVLGAVIGFRDQRPNQELALEGSLNGILATLDLSEASDRVSFQHVVSMLHRFPQSLEAVSACRSTRAEVPSPDGDSSRVITLAKFASMGSALCFPMEALVFTIAIAMAFEMRWHENAAKSWPENAEPQFAIRNRRDLRLALRGVRVYGDDIVVPVDLVAPVMRVFDALGFKVNTLKSFWKGNFRESCGKEYFSGQDVSIVRVRQEFPTSPENASEVVSMVSLRNQLHARGLFKTATWLDTKIEKILPLYPTVLPNSPVLGKWATSYREITVDGWDQSLHVPVVRGYVVKSRSPINSVDGDLALLKYFLKRGIEPFRDKEHLERSGRPDAVYLKRRTVPVTETVFAKEIWQSPWLEGPEAF